MSEVLKAECPIARIAVELQVARSVVRRVHAVIIDAVGHGTDQRSIVVVVECDRHSRAEAGDPSQHPVPRPSIAPPRQLRKRQRDVVAENEILPHIEGGDCAALALSMGFTSSERLEELSMDLL